MQPLRVMSVHSPVAPSRTGKYDSKRKSVPASARAGNDNSKHKAAPVSLRAGNDDSKRKPVPPSARSGNDDSKCKPAPAPSATGNDDDDAELCEFVSEEQCEAEVPKERITEYSLVKSTKRRARLKKKDVFENDVRYWSDGEWRQVEKELKKLALLPHDDANESMLKGRVHEGPFSEWSLYEMVKPGLFWGDEIVYRVAKYLAAEHLTRGAGKVLVEDPQGVASCFTKETFELLPARVARRVARQRKLGP